MKGRLNLFQAAMLRWRELYPYNAVHAVRVDAELDRSRLANDIDLLLEGKGLTGLELDVPRRRFEYRGGRHGPALRIVDGANDARAALEREMEWGLNVRFDHDGRLEPFRFFAVDAGTCFHLGLAYDHVVAAGDSIVVLLALIARRYLANAADVVAAEPFARYPATYRRLFRRRFGPLVRGMRRLPGLAQSCRRGVRPRFPGGADAYNAVAFFRLDPPELAAALRTAKSWEVTLNDLLLALLLTALANVIGPRDPRQRRHEIGVASIVNLRRDMSPDVEGAFGQFLSSFRIAHPVPAGVGLERVARDVKTQTARVKREELHLQPLLAMGASALTWRFLSAAQRSGYYAKNYPVWSGITMLDAGALWERAGGPPLAEYSRVVSTGPLAPMVLAPTTAGGMLRVGVTYRTAAFSRDDIACMAAQIRSHVEAISK